MSNPEEALKPFWHNGCNHSEEEFLGTVTRDGPLVDVYVWDQFGELDVCIRYGNDPEQYESHGHVLQYLTSPHANEDIKQLILDNVEFSCNRKRIVNNKEILGKEPNNG